MTQEELNLLLKNNNIHPLQFIKQGASSFFGTNEKVRPDIFLKLKKTAKRPTGYLLGVGVSSMFTALSAFKGLPLGVILINPDPKVVETIRQFTEVLKKGAIYYSSKESEQFYFDTKQEQPPAGYVDPTTKNIEVFSLLKFQAEKLVELISLDKLFVIQNDIFNPQLLNLLINVFSDLRNHTNIINLSNVGDWIKRANNDERILNAKSTEVIVEYWKQKFSMFNNLNILEPVKPNINYFMYTSVNTDYFQTITSGDIPDDPNLYSEINKLKLLKTIGKIQKYSIDHR